MADDIKDRPFSGTESYEQAFNRMSKGSTEYGEALRKLSEELGRMNDLTDIQEKQLEDWLKTLEDISDSWEEINKYIEDDLKDFDTFKKDLTDIRSLFTNILKDLQPTRRQATEHVGLLKNFRDLTGEIQRATVVQNGTSEASLNSLTKRVQKAKEQYEWTVRNLTADRSLSTESIREARDREAARVAELEKEKEGIDNRVKSLQRRLAKKDLTGYQKWDTAASLNEALAQQREFNKAKAAELDLHRSNVEILQDEVKEAINYADASAQSLRDKGRAVRRDSKGLNMAAKIAEKFGVAGAKDDYEDYVQRRVRGEAGGGAQMLAGWLKSALTLSGVLTAIGLTISNIWKGLKEVSSEAAKLQQNIGKFDVSLASANTKFASSVDWLKTANELASQFYINPVSLFDSKEIATLAEAKNLLGYSAEQAGNLGTRAKMAGQTFESYEKSIDKGIHAGQAANKTAFAHNLIAKDVLSTTDATALSMGNNVTQISKAAVAARTLGMNLEGVQKIAENLINFESSIENEMKAQLLTGNQLNLSRARGLALQNDLEGVAKEISRQGLTVAEFNKMNYIQQKAYAEALGMSREELAKMVIQQDLSGKVTDEMKAKALGVTIEQSKAMGISERWHKAVEKLAQAFTPLLNVITAIITPISNMVAWVGGIIGKMGTLGQTLAIVGLIGVASFTRIMATGRSTIASLLGGVGRLAKAFKLNGVGGTIGSRIKGAFGGKAGSTVTSAAGAGSKAKGTGSGLKQLGKNMAGFFTAWKKVTVGDIGKATLGTLALLPTIAVAPGIAVLAGTGLISQKGLPALGKGLAGFFRALKTTTLKSIGIATAATVPIVLLTAVAPGVAILAGAGLLAGKALPALGRGLAGFFRALGSIPPPMLLFASIAVAVITGALIGIGFALKLAAPAIEAVGNMIKSVLEGIGTVIEKAAIGFGQLAEAVKGMSFEDIGKLALLGPTLLALGGSLLLATPGLLLGGIGLWVFTRRIKKLSEAGKGVPKLADGMRQLAGAVGELKANLSDLDTGKLNDITNSWMKISAVKTITGVVHGLGKAIKGIGKALGITSDSGEISSANTRTQRARAASNQASEEQASNRVSTAKIENLLTAIVNRLNEGYDVYLDADKVGRTLAVRTV